MSGGFYQIEKKKLKFLLKIDHFFGGLDVFVSFVVSNLIYKVSELSHTHTHPLLVM